jgi:hypothetical protein
VNSETFNALYEVGIPVFAYPGARPEDDREARRLVTRTRSKAQKSSSGHDVVWVDGEGSYISLTHVDVVPEDVWEAANTADAVAAEGALPVPAGPESQGSEVDADTVAARAAQVISNMGAEIRSLTKERDRYRAAWHNARDRAASAQADVEFVEQRTEAAAS